MKTRNSNLQKAGLETLTAIVILVATCFTIHAQGAGYKGSFSDDTELASARSITYAPAPSAKVMAKAELAAFAEILTEDAEEEAVVESWMTDAAYFGVAELTSDLEEAMKIEEWMLHESNFEVSETEPYGNHSDRTHDVKKPKTIGVTFPGAQFGRRAFILIEMEDPILELEPWMVDQQVWNPRQ